MIHEYLFLTDENRANIEAFKPDGITVEISNIHNTLLWVVTYSLPSKNEDGAKKLSDVHTHIMQYSPLVLSCESSEYYNRTLFPLINELERKLRKLLYLAASISDNEKAKESIKQLEEKDFGDIFDLLFIDQSFILDMKKRINADSKSEFSGQSKYSKVEIQSYLDSLAEHTLWDTILGNKDVSTLRSRFRDVQTYRNDVMHAHNISKELFGKSHYLFNKINQELDGAISNLIGSTEGGPKEAKPDVNTAISSALVAMELSTISEAHNSATALSVAISQFSQALKVMQPTPAEVVRNLNLTASNPTLMETIKALEPFRESVTLAEALRGILPSFQVSPTIESIRKQRSQNKVCGDSELETIDGKQEEDTPNA